VLRIANDYRHAVDVWVQLVGLSAKAAAFD